MEARLRMGIHIHAFHFSYAHQILIYFKHHFDFALYLKFLEEIVPMLHNT